MERKLPVGIQDFEKLRTDNFLYVDKTVGIPNRARCDIFIEENSKKLLTENYSCLKVRH